MDLPTAPKAIGAGFETTGRLQGASWEVVLARAAIRTRTLPPSVTGSIVGLLGDLQTGPGVVFAFGYILILQGTLGLERADALRLALDDSSTGAPRGFCPPAG